MSYIVPRDKPKRCTQPRCRFMDRDTLDCRLQDKSWESFEEQYEHCPLISIPTPHGRLIDADVLINELASEHVGGLEAIKKYTNADTWTAGLHTAWRTIDDADPVIEAEE